MRAMDLGPITMGFEIGDMVENTTVRGTRGIVTERDPSGIFFKVEWIVKDEEERGPLITTNSVMDLRLLSPPIRC